MPNFNVAIQTNYFHVDDEELFAAFMNQVVVDDDSEITLEFKAGKDGRQLVRFRSTGAILGIDLQAFLSYGQYPDDVNYDDFLYGLQDFVAEDDAIIMMEFGADDVGSGYANATIITMSDTDYIEFQDLVTSFAEDMLMQQSAK